MTKTLSPADDGGELTTMTHPDTGLEVTISKAWAAQLATQHADKTTKTATVKEK